MLANGTKSVNGTGLDSDSNCLDNSKAENFFSMLKTELYFDWEGESVQELEIAVRGYIDWHNTRRVKMGLKGKGPVEYRLDWAA